MVRRTPGRDRFHYPAAPLAVEPRGMPRHQPAVRSPPWTRRLIPSAADPRRWPGRAASSHRPPGPPWPGRAVRRQGGDAAQARRCVRGLAAAAV